MKIDWKSEIYQVTDKIVIDKKTKVAIQRLSINSAIPVEIYESDIIPSENLEDSHFLNIKKGYCEPIALETDENISSCRLWLGCKG